VIIVAGYIAVPGDGMAKLLPVAKETLAATRREAGCIVYTFAIDVVDPTHLRVYEEWESRAALDGHGRQPHMTPWRAKLAEVHADAGHVFSYEAGAGRPM
jgi:quinol monooxygenase YgiN